MWKNIEKRLFSYLLMCKDIENIGYDMMSQWINKKFKEICLCGNKNKTSKNVPD